MLILIILLILSIVLGPISKIKSSSSILFISLICDLSFKFFPTKTSSGKVILQDGQSSDSSIGNFLKLYTYGHYNYEIHNLTNNSWNLSYQHSNLNISQLLDFTNDPDLYANLLTNVNSNGNIVFDYQYNTNDVIELHFANNYNINDIQAIVIQTNGGSQLIQNSYFEFKRIISILAIIKQVCCIFIKLNI